MSDWEKEQLKILADIMKETRDTARKSREKCNPLILAALQKFLETGSDQRFIQALYNLDIVENDGPPSYNEESEVTLAKVNRALLKLNQQETQ